MADSVLSLAVKHIITMINEQPKAIILSIVRSEAEALCTELQVLENVFVDIDGNHFELTNNEQVHTWLAEVRRIAYDAEDVVDRLVFKTESMAFSSLRGLTGAIRATKKLGVIKQRAEDMKKELDAYFEELSRLSTTPWSEQIREVLSLQQVQPHTNDNFVVGVDADVERLAKILFGKLQNKLVEVLAIVGMGGSGKSTIARKIYNHGNVGCHFSYKAWVTVGWDASSEQLLSELYKQMTSCWTRSAQYLIRLASKSTDHDQHRHRDDQMKYLQNLLKTRKCLVVFDDVWDWTTINEIVHELIQPSDLCRVSKSKIVITSRQRLLRPNTHLKWDCYETKSLSDEDSWKLFEKVSSSDRAKKRLAIEYQGFSKHMLTKCKGLPLAIVALGRLLKDEESIQEWDRMFNQLKSEGPYLYGPVNDVLALSYYVLPRHLKPCFLYLGLLATNDIISAGALIRMWIAEGFVKYQQNNDETPEKAAKGLLEELVNHTMVQVVTGTSTDKVIKLRINDLMRDICVMIAEKQEFLTLLPSDSDQDSGEMHPRRIAINLSNCSTLPRFNSDVRSLRIYDKSSTDKGLNDQQFGLRVNQQGTLDLDFVCQKFKLLRVLDINGVQTSDGRIPKKIGDLIHLRYLGITSTNIQKLPKSIGKLRRLITLDYRDVCVYNSEIRLPNIFWKLKQLRHLFLPNEMVSNKSTYLKLDTLKNLQTLWGVKGGDWMVTELRNLSLSVTKLYIQGISSLEQLNAVFSTHNHIDVLALDWHGFQWESLHEINTETRLRKLRLMGRAPNFTRHQNFPSELQKLELYYTQLECQKTLDAIGRLPSLKFLKLARESFMGEEWKCGGDDRFPKLEELQLSNLPKLRDWIIERGAMPCLKRLSIASCTTLNQLPKGLKSISTLETLKVSQMPTDFNRRFQKLKGWFSTNVGGEDFHIVQHIPNIEITDSRNLLSL